jgi:hypothetical protein
MFSSTSGLFGLTANVLSALLPLLIFIFVARATPADSLFFYHPISMAFAFLLLMPQGVLVLTSNTHFFKFLLGESNRRAKVSIHFWTQVRFPSFTIFPPVCNPCTSHICIVLHAIHVSASISLNDQWRFREASLFMHSFELCH